MQFHASAHHLRYCDLRALRSRVYGDLIAYFFILKTPLSRALHDFRFTAKNDGLHFAVGSLHRDSPVAAARVWSNLRHRLSLLDGSALALGLPSRTPCEASRQKEA